MTSTLVKPLDDDLDGDDSSDDDEHTVDTLPPPASGNVYSAQTVVRELPEEVLAHIREAAAAKRARDATARDAATPSSRTAVPAPSGPSSGPLSPAALRQSLGLPPPAPMHAPPRPDPHAGPLPPRPSPPRAGGGAPAYPVAGPSPAAYGPDVTQPLPAIGVDFPPLPPHPMSGPPSSPHAGYPPSGASPWSGAPSSPQSPIPMSAPRSPHPVSGPTPVSPQHPRGPAPGAPPYATGPALQMPVGTAGSSRPPFPANAQAPSFPYSAGVPMSSPPSAPSSSMPTARSAGFPPPTARPAQTPVSFSAPKGLAGDVAPGHTDAFAAFTASSSRPPSGSHGASQAPPAVHAPFDVPVAGRGSLEAIAQELRRAEAARDAEAARKRFYATAVALAVVLVLLILFGLRATRH